MSPTSVFRWSRRAAAAAGIGAVVAMLVYPGGTFRDHSTSGYQFFHNFFSDLGATVAFDGRPNHVGATLFVASLVTVVVSMGATLLGLVRLYSKAPKARTLARIAGAIGLFVCACFIAVAATPENRVLGLHVLVTRLAFRAFPGVALFLGLASRHVEGISPRATAAWFVLLVLLVAYVLILDLGPRASTPFGLVVQVAAQKAVAVGAVLLLVYQAAQAERLLEAERQS